MERICGDMHIALNEDGLLIIRKKGLRLRLSLLPLDPGLEHDFPQGYNSVIALTNGLEGGTTQVVENGDALLFIRRTGKLIFRQRITPTDDGCRLSTSVQGDLAALPRSLSLLGFSRGCPDDGDQVFMTGESMGGQRLAAAGSVESGSVSKVVFAVQHENESAWLLYSVPGYAFPLFIGKLERGWYGFCKLPPHPAGDSLDLGCLTLRLGERAWELLQDLAASSAVPQARRSPVCWNSWDYYRSAISHDIIMENVRALAADPLLKNLVECIVLDMGWETRHGEWAPDPNFPHGMDDMARDITACGFRAGLWLAPAIIDPECNFLQEDYRWACTTNDGFPDLTFDCCGLFGYPLDISRPQGRQFIHDLFSRLREMGYTYFKLDFLRYLMYPQQYEKGWLTYTQLIQELMSVIRQAVGEDSYILGCGLPLEIGPGYCDAARVSGDVAVFWNNIYNNARSVTLTSFLNGHWWVNDPDFLVVRGRDTWNSDKSLYRLWWFLKDAYSLDALVKVHRKENTLSLAEAQLHASMELLCNGALVMADPLMYVDDKARDMVVRVLTAERGPGMPLDPFRYGAPSPVWVQYTRTLLRVGLFNWTEAERTVEITAAEIGAGSLGDRARDFWTGETVTGDNGSWSCRLQPHSCRVLEFAIPGNDTASV